MISADYWPFVLKHGHPNGAKGHSSFSCPLFAHSKILGPLYSVSPCNSVGIVPVHSLPLLELNCGICFQDFSLLFFCFLTPPFILGLEYKCDSGSMAANNLVGWYVNCSNNFTSNVIKGSWTSDYLPKKWKLHSTATDNIEFTEEEKKTWNDSREALSAFKFSPEEEDKILGKAFGQIHSPYWYEERKNEVPRLEVVNEILDYLRSLSLTDDDLTKLLKKFPEVLGCSLEDEMKNNVEILAKQWGIEGKTLTKVLLRNPKVLGYNVDCKGDCVAKCTRCWARF